MNRLLVTWLITGTILMAGMIASAVPADKPAMTVEAAADAQQVVVKPQVTAKYYILRVKQADGSYLLILLVKGTGDWPDLFTYNLNVDGSAPVPPVPPTPGTIVITTTAMPNGKVGSAYLFPLTVSGGTPPYVWKITAGSWPAGIGMTAAGVVEGTPTTPQTSSVTISCTDSSATALSASATLSLTIDPGAPVPSDLRAAAAAISKAAMAKVNNYVVDQNTIATVYHNIALAFKTTANPGGTITDSSQVGRRTQTDRENAFADPTRLAAWQTWVKAVNDWVNEQWKAGNAKSMDDLYLIWMGLSDGVKK